MGYKYPSLRTTLPVAGYYAKLDSGAAATDQFTTDGANDGTLTNGATRVDDGGLAYSFDGVNDHIAFTPPSIGTAALTLAAWAKETTSRQDDHLIKIGTATTNNAFGIYKGGPGNSSKMFAGLHGNNASEASATVTATAWNHYAAVLTSTSVKLYVNGTLAATTTGTFSYNIGTTFGRVGSAQSTLVPWVGMIDDVLIYAADIGATNIGYLATQRGAIYQLIAGSSPINGQSLIRPADIRPAQLLIG